MRLKVSSGDYREVIEVPVEDRRQAHRLGCVFAVRSGKGLGQIICTSIHLDDGKDFADDDLFTLTELVKEIVGRA